LSSSAEFSFLSVLASAVLSGLKWNATSGRVGQCRDRQKLRL
jgi:hypothetical protein